MEDPPATTEFGFPMARKKGIASLFGPSATSPRPATTIAVDPPPPPPARVTVRTQSAFRRHRMTTTTMTTTTIKTRNASNATTERRTG